MHDGEIGDKGSFFPEIFSIWREICKFWRKLWFSYLKTALQKENTFTQEALTFSLKTDFKKWTKCATNDESVSQFNCWLFLALAFTKNTRKWSRIALLPSIMNYDHSNFALLQIFYSNKAGMVQQKSNWKQFLVSKVFLN